MTGILKIVRRIWEAGVARWPVTEHRRGGGVLSITAAAWTAGFHWWRSGNITRTQNVSKYVLVLALCLIYYFSVRLQLLLLCCSEEATEDSLTELFSQYGRVDVFKFFR